MTRTAASQAVKIDWTVGWIIYGWSRPYHSASLSPTSPSHYDHPTSPRGARLRIERHSAGEVFLEQRTKLTEGRSEVLAVPDVAIEVVLRKGEEIVGRLPVRPSRREVFVVRG